VQFGNVVINQ